jgi:hypothetical protein
MSDLGIREIIAALSWFAYLALVARLSDLCLGWLGLPDLLRLLLFFPLLGVGALLPVFLFAYLESRQRGRE